MTGVIREAYTSHHQLVAILDEGMTHSLTNSQFGKVFWDNFGMSIVRKEYSGLFLVINPLRIYWLSLLFLLCF